MSNPSPNKKASRIQIGDDGEIVGQTLPVPNAARPLIRLPVSNTVLITLVLTIALSTGTVLSLLGLIRPGALLSAITRPLCLSRLGRERILFLSQRDSDTGLYIMNTDGTNPCRLLDDGLGQGYPKPSSDGRSIYYVMQHSGVSELEVVNVDGTNIRSLYAVGDLRDEGLAASPDNRRFAVAKKAITMSQLWVMNGDGSAAIRVSPGNASAYLPDWSADGRHIAFVTEAWITPYIYVVDSNGDNGHRLTATDNAEGFPAWSPDSNQIAFSRDTRGDGSTLQIFIANADGSNIRQLTRQGTRNTFPRFTPDGKRVLFSSDRDVESPDLYIMDLDGSHIRRLTNGGNISYSIWFAVKP